MAKKTPEPKPDKTFPGIRGSLARLLFLIPSSKYGPVLEDAKAVELALLRWERAEHLLRALRKYFLESTGEMSPFIAHIDKILPEQPK